MNSSADTQPARQKVNQNIRVYVRVRPLNARERGIRSYEVVDVAPPKEIVVRQLADSKMTKKFTFDRTFGVDSRQSELYSVVVAPFIEEVLGGYNCTVFAYGQTGTGKTHTMIGTECPELKSSWEDESMVGIIPRALSHLFDELRLMQVEFSMRISYLELYNEELCDLLSTDDSNKIRIFDDANKKGSVIIQGLEEIPVHSKDDVYKLLEKGKERRKTAITLMNAQSSRSHTVFSILVHIKENGLEGEEMLKIGKLNLVDLAGSENISKAGNEKGIRARETVNINQSLLTLGRVITALVERTPHIPYRESKLTRLLQESLGGRTKTSIIATISPGHKDLEETLSTLEYAHRAKNIQNKPEVNQRLTKKTVLKEYTEEIDKLKRDLMAARDKNGIYLAEDTYNDMQYKLDSQNKELNEKMLLVRALKDDLANKEKLFNEVSLHLVEKSKELKKVESHLTETKNELQFTKKVLTTAKKGIKEKKYLLNTHMKTEKELTSQAKKLVEVADVATHDTIILHKTIEQRKFVEEENRNVCDRFVNNLKESFEEMNEKLNQFQTKHNSYSQTLIEDIDKNKKSQKQFSDDLLKSMNSIYESHKESLNDMNIGIEKYSAAAAENNNEYKSNLGFIVNEMKSKINTLHSNLSKQLYTMLELISKQNSTLKQNCANISEKVSEYNDKTKEFSKTTADNLEKLVTNLRSATSEEIQILDLAINKKKSIMAKRKNAIKIFENNLKIFFDELKAVDVDDENETIKVEELSKKILKTTDDVCNKVDKEISSIDLHEKLCENNVINLDEKINSFQVNLATSLIASKLKTTDTRDIINKNQDEMLSMAGNLFKTHENNLQKANALIEESVNSAKSSKEIHIAEMDGKIKTATEIINCEQNRLNHNLVNNMELYKFLQNDVNEYSCAYHEHMKNANVILDAFHKTELKQYIPSGETPSKKEFSYPRLLAATSPHIRILERLRNERGWSDMDNSFPLTEDSLSEISSTSIVMNSTPVKINQDKIVQNTDVALKVPNLIKSMERLPLSAKNSPANLITENKENVSGPI